MSASAITDLDTPATLSPAVLLVMRHRDVGVYSGGGASPVPLAIGDLFLLDAIGRGDTRALGQVIDDLAEVGGLDIAALRATAQALQARGLLEPRAAGPAATPRVSVPTVGSPGADGAAPDLPGTDERLLLVTPLVLRPTPMGFEHLDHDGRLTIHLDGQQLAAASTFREARTLAEAHALHLGEAGSLALEASRFEQLVADLTDVGLVIQPDPDDAGGRENREAREIYGYFLRASRATDEAVVEHTRLEQEREAKTGTTRTKVVPIDHRASPVPLGLGMIVAHARAYKSGALEDHFQFVPEWLTRDDRLESLASEPSIFLFSNYIWSHGQNLSMSERIKRASPHSVTVHGGPDTPKYEGDVEAYLEANPHVDVAVHGEGEATTAELLEALVGALGDGRPDLSRLADVPGLTFRDAGRLVHTGHRERIAELDVIPSPFLTGLFDVHAAAGLSMAIIETNRGCPYGCTFCDWGSATLARIRKFDLSRVFAELEWCAQHEVARVFVADANFGIFDRDVEIAEKVAELKARYGYPTLFSTNYAKNSTKHLRKIVGTLAEAGILTQGLLSLQSMDAGTLRTVKRSNIKLDKYEDLARSFRQADLPLFVDLMLGLPGSSQESFRYDLQSCIDREITAKIYPTELLVNSPMNEPDYRSEHRIETSAPLGALDSSSRLSDGSTKRALLVSTASYTRDDYAHMLELRRVFMVSENFGVLRQVSRFVRQETGIAEIDFYERLRLLTRDDPGRLPILAFTFHAVPFVGCAPVSWRLLIDELHDHLVGPLGMADDDALATVLQVQHALLPTRGRTFPQELDLAHDYAAWHASILDAKDRGEYDWCALVPRLGTLSPGRFVVDDPHEVCQKGIGFEIDENLHASWELGSSVARAVSHEHQWAG